MRTINPLYRTLPLLALLLCPGLVDAVERVPPAIYKEQLESELTPIAPLLGQVGYFSPEKSDHGCVLQENIVYIDTRGHTYELFHYAYKALSNGDLDEVGTASFYFRPDTENIYLIEAETLLPDGSVRTVPPEGIILQTPQRDQDKMIFSGRKQLRLIFPQVSLGSVTHCIVLVERESSRIPGHYTDRYSWERGWQTHLKRAVLNLERADRERLRIVPLGEGIPEAAESTTEDGRVRLEWRREKLPVRSDEKLDGPIIQTGPMLFLSTLKDWNEFAAWYAACIRESSIAGNAVRAVAREWAEGAADEDAIIHNLAFRVANDIRYVSLEFGVGGLQPQPVDSVLENRFGDCKDKANFLRVLLQEHGIESHVVLVNTDHAGRVEERCADYAYFDHAILQIRKDSGETIYCDPTLKYGSAGLLYPAIANRPVLVIDEHASTARWATTPAASAGDLDYGLDLRLANDGGLSGWFTAKATGYYACSLSGRFEATEHESLKYEVEKYLGYFYDASSVIDFEITRATKDAQEFFLKTYFIREATGQAKRSVSWPSIKWLLPRLGEEKDVKREAFLWTDNVHVGLRIGLPDGTGVASMPDEWSVKSRGFSASGTWYAQDGEGAVGADLRAGIAESRYSPAEFPRLFNAVDATCHWLEKIVILGQGETRSAGTTGRGTALGDEFVLMGTGKGQVGLVDHLYPEDTKPAERRLALAKTKAWFPKDAQTQFDCDVRVGWLEYNAKQFEKSLAIAQEACRNYGEQVDPLSRGWARYLEAMSLEEVGKVEESLAIFLALETDPELNGFRKGFAAYQYARIMAGRDEVETARDYYFKALAYDSYNERWMLEHSYVFLLDHATQADWNRFFADLRTTKPEKEKSIVVWLGEFGQGNAARLRGLVYAAGIRERLAGIEGATAMLDPEVAGKLDELDANYRSYLGIRSDVAAHFEGCGYAFWQVDPDRLRSFDEYVDDIKKAIDANDIALSLRLALWRIIHLDPEVEFPEWIWDAARMSDYLCKNGQRELEPLRQLLFDTRPRLPANEDGTIDLKFIIAESLEREGHADEALAVYQELYGQQLEQRWLVSLFRRWTALLTNTGHGDQALEIYAQARTLVKDDADFLPFAIQGIYALLEQGDIEEAKGWMVGMHETCKTLGIDNDLVAHVAQWVELEDQGLLESFWQFRDSWWPQWMAARSAMGLPTNEVPCQATFHELGDAGKRLGSAIVQKDADTVSRELAGMFYGAKWHPAVCAEAESLMSFMVKHYPDAEAELYRCAAALDSEAFQLDPEVKYACRTRALDALLELEEYAELLERAEACYNDPESDQGASMYARYGSLAAVNLDRAGTAWVGRMEKQLEIPEQRSDPYAVNILSRLYRQEGRIADERDLLQEYLAGATDTGGEMHKLLKGRFEQVQQLTDGNQRLTGAFEEWLATNPPGWLAIFPDPALADMEIPAIVDRLEEIRKQDESPSFEQATFLIQAARDERLSSTAREEAFFSFLVKALGPMWETEANLAMIDQAAKDARLSDSLRSRCAHFSANLAYIVGIPGFVEQTLLPNLESLGLEDEVGDRREPLVAYSNLDRFSAEAISAWMDRAAETMQPFDRQGLYLLNQAYEDLCWLGAVDRAEHQIAQARKFRFDSNANGSSFALQLQWRQQLDRVKEAMPLHDVMQAFFDAALKPDFERPQFSTAWRFPHASDPVRLQPMIRTLLQYRLFDHQNVAFWSDVNEAEYLNGNICLDEHNFEQLFRQLLDACGKDRQYVMAIGIINELYDTDNAACQRLFDAMTQPLLSRAELEETRHVLAWNQYRRLIRQGEGKRAYIDLRSERNLSKQQLHELSMMALLAAGDKKLLGDYLGSADPDLLLGDHALATTLNAYRLCGRQTEYDLLKDKGIEVLHEFMADAVQSGGHPPVYIAIELARSMDAMDALDPAWARLVENRARKDSAAYMRMHLCFASKDWPGTAAAAKILVDCKPLHYENYYYLGKALIEQGRREEGDKALAPFLAYCKDSEQYGDAVRLHEQIQAKPKP